PLAKPRLPRFTFMRARITRRRFLQTTAATGAGYFFTASAVSATRAADGPKAQHYPSAQKFFDFRKMLDEMGKEIDAVTVSTPDHTHAPASIMAMKMKKHVYT